MQLESMYREIILDHYRRPHHKGLRDPYDAEVHHINPTCGDEVTLRVTLKDAGGEPVVADVSYDALGCSISQASVSVMADMIIGKTVHEAMGISGAFLELMQSRGAAEPDEDVLGDAVAFEGVSKYPARIKCALLGWMAWKDATAQALPGHGPEENRDGSPEESPDGSSKPHDGTPAANSSREQT
jgi:nitrogen fixation protein NifU and related proteins